MALRLIQAGVGGMGEAWVKALAVRYDIDVVALVDLNDAALAKAGEALDVPADARFRTLLGATDRVPADAVLTVTPPAVHAEHAAIAFASGMHLLTEKPIGSTLAVARKMVKQAEAAGKILMVAQNYRYSATMRTLARMTGEQKLGPLGSGHIGFYIPGDFRGTFRQTMQQPLLVDMAIHHLDLIRAVTGQNIATVTADTFNPPGSDFEHHAGLNMLLRLENGVPFAYTGDWTARGRGTTWNGAWRLQFERGAIELTADGKIVVSTSDYWNNDTHTANFDNDAAAEEAQSALLTRFVAACKTGEPPETSGQDNLWSFAAVTAGVISAAEHRTVRVAELLDD